jgi:hypothetical protein
MNTDLLDRILNAIADDYRTTNVQSHLRELVTGLCAITEPFALTWMILTRGSSGNMSTP